MEGGGAAGQPGASSPLSYGDDNLAVGYVQYRGHECCSNATPVTAACTISESVTYDYQVLIATAACGLVEIHAYTAR